MLKQDELTFEIRAAATEVHRAIGPGLLESAYEQCLAHELSLRNLAFERQRILPVRYKNVRLDGGYRIDFVVEEKCVLELKCVEQRLPLFTAQTLTYMKLGGYSIGLLINFNVPLLKDGIKRLVL